VTFPTYIVYKFVLYQRDLNIRHVFTEKKFTLTQLMLGVICVKFNKYKQCTLT